MANYSCKKFFFLQSNA